MNPWLLFGLAFASGACCVAVFVAVAYSEARKVVDRAEQDDWWGMTEEDW